MFSFEGEIRKCTKYGKAIFPCFRASRLVSEVGNVEKVKSASNTVDATRNFILRRIEDIRGTALGSYSQGYVRVYALLFILRIVRHLFRFLFFWQFTPEDYSHESQCSKTRKYSLIVFSIFLRIYSFGGQKQSTLIHFRLDHTGEKHRIHGHTHTPNMVYTTQYEHPSTNWNKVLPATKRCFVHRIFDMASTLYVLADERARAGATTMICLSQNPFEFDTKRA